MRPVLPSGLGHPGVLSGLVVTCVPAEDRWGTQQATAQPPGTALPWPGPLAVKNSIFPHPSSPPRKFSYFLAYKRFNFMWSNPSTFLFGPHFIPFKLGKAPRHQGAGSSVYLVLQEGLGVWYCCRAGEGPWKEHSGRFSLPGWKGGAPLSLAPRHPALGSLLTPGPVPKPPRLLPGFTTQGWPPPATPTTRSRPCMSSRQPSTGSGHPGPQPWCGRPDSYGC